MRPALFAVIVAEATNLGIATMATASGIAYGHLGQTWRGPGEEPVAPRASTPTTP